VQEELSADDIIADDDSEGDSNQQGMSGQKSSQDDDRDNTRKEAGRR